MTAPREASVEALAERVQRLEDIESIRDLIARYAQGADRKNDPAIMDHLFAEDAVWECPGFGRYEGRKEVIRSLAEVGRTRILWTLHYMIAPVIQIEPGSNHATGSWFLWELATARGQEGEPPDAHWVGGNYDADFIRTAEGWKFRRVLLTLKLFCPYTEGWAKSPLPSL